MSATESLGEGQLQNLHFLLEDGLKHRCSDVLRAVARTLFRIRLAGSNWQGQKQEEEELHFWGSDKVSGLVSRVDYDGIVNVTLYG